MMNSTQQIEEILAKNTFTNEDIVCLLSANNPLEIEMIFKKAQKVLFKNCGNYVYYRGLIEFSNQCINNCLYCGIRAGNKNIRRYKLSEEEIISLAKWCSAQGYGSVVLQSGERRDNEFVSFVEHIVRRIKKETTSEKLPSGLGITLCVGEQDRTTYERFFKAGAHRYLLRIETTDPNLFASIHPPDQKIETRMECLKNLREIGFQVGTGVMIGLPGQTIKHLAADIEFFKNMDIDMIGMGPYIPHHQTPMKNLEKMIRSPKERLALALRMIAVSRIVLQDVNIAATTALQALAENGREQGLLAGANVIMPQLTPTAVRRDYLLYDGKPCLEEDALLCKDCLKRRIESIGRIVAIDKWGDSPHATKRISKQQ